MQETLYKCARLKISRCGVGYMLIIRRPMNSYDALYHHRICRTLRCHICEHDAFMHAMLRFGDGMAICATCSYKEINIHLL